VLGVQPPTPTPPPPSLPFPTATKHHATYVVLGVLEVEHEAAVLALVLAVRVFVQMEQLPLRLPGHLGRTLNRHLQVRLLEPAEKKDKC